MSCSVSILLSYLHYNLSFTSRAFSSCLLLVSLWGGSGGGEQSFFQVCFHVNWFAFLMFYHEPLSHSCKREMRIIKLNDSMKFSTCVRWKWSVSSWLSAALKKKEEIFKKYTFWQLLIQCVQIHLLLRYAGSERVQRTRLTHTVLWSLIQKTHESILQKWLAGFECMNEICCSICKNWVNVWTNKLPPQEFARSSWWADVASRLVDFVLRKRLISRSVFNETSAMTFHQAGICSVLMVPCYVHFATPESASWRTLTQTT